MSGLVVLKDKLYLRQKIVDTLDFLTQQITETYWKQTKTKNQPRIFRAWWNSNAQKFEHIFT